MDHLKIEDIKEFDSKRLDAKIEECRLELFNLNMMKTTTRMEKPHLVKVLKKNIARLLTVKTMKNRNDK